MMIETLVNPYADARARLDRLSEKERAVLDQILLHKPLKVIAHELGITLSAVDQRLKSARIKLGAADRNEAARLYTALLSACRESTCGFADLVEPSMQGLSDRSEQLTEPTFMLGDSATFVVPPPWPDRRHQEPVSKILDEKFGKPWRVIAIPLLALTMAILALALIAMARALGDLL